MLNNISWAGYTYPISIILIIYYAPVFIIYYRNDVQSYVSRATRRFNQASPGGLISTEKKDNFFERNEQRDLENISICELSLNIQSLIKTAASRNFRWEELLLSLQLQLRKYAGEKNINFKDDISNYIIAACEDYCSIHLSVEEVSALWIE